MPLIVGDAMFAKTGSLAYMDRDHSGLWGDVIMVNGVPWPYHEVERRFYRFRILLATLSRSMNLRFVNTRTGATMPAYVVATDGGLTRPQPITSWRHAGAERYEVMVDFAGCRIGDTRRAAQREQQEQRRLPAHRQGHAVPGHVRVHRAHGGTRCRRRRPASCTP